MKRIISLLLALILCASMGIVAFADYTGIDTDNENSSVNLFLGDTPRAEETEWVIRWYDGLIQKRLWSLTYGVWLTDWITIGYYDP